MTTYTFERESDLYLATLCLRMAADKFAANATELSGLYGGQHGLVRQFKDQETRARQIADYIETANYATGEE